MKKESMVGRRLYAWILDTLLLVVLAFVFDGLLTIPIINNITKIEEISASYLDNSKAFENIQDEYNIYIYDEANNRIYNNNVTEEIKDAFLNDERIINLKEEMAKEQEYIVKNFIFRICLSILFSSLVTYIIIPLIFKNGKTLGKFASKLNVVSDNYEYASWYKIIIRSILSIIFNIYLAIFSLGMVPLFSLLIAISSKDNKAIPDFICKTIVVDAKIPIEVKRIKD